MPVEMVQTPMPSEIVPNLDFPTLRFELGLYLPRAAECFSFSSHDLLAYYVLANLLVIFGGLAGRLEAMFDSTEQPGLRLCFFLRSVLGLDAASGGGDLIASFNFLDFFRHTFRGKVRWPGDLLNTLLLSEKSF